MKNSGIVVFFVCLLMALSVKLNAQSSSQQKIMEAVMQVYDEELKKNPNDYAVLYSRANQYLLNGELQKALDDVNAALKVTTRDDMAMLVDEYLLRAKIYTAMGKPAESLADLQEANRLSPSSPNVLKMLAEAYYQTGDYANAKKCFLSLYRMNNIDYLAILGLARTEFKLNNLGQASDYANQAVNLYPAEPAVYVGRAEVLSMMDRKGEAAQDLILALSLDGENGMALRMLMQMSDVAYNEVLAALDASINKAPDVGMFYYIKASIQVEHNHYADALRSLEEIISRKLYDYHGIYFDAASSAYNICKYDDALKYVDTAISMRGDIAYYYVLKSQILSAMNRVDDAYVAIKTASIGAPEDRDVLYQKAMLDIDRGEYRDALQGLNVLLMTVPDDVKATYLRGWLKKNKLNDKDAAQSDFNSILMLGSGIESLRGFALHQLGRDAEAAKWCEDIVKDNFVAGGEAYFTAAVLMSQCGKAEVALDYLDKALANGYGSYYDVMINESPLTSLEDVRYMEQFKTIVAKYDSLFK